MIFLLDNAYDRSKLSSRLMEPLPPVIAPVRPLRVEYPVSRRLERLRKLTWIMDQWIGLPGGFRVGLDPVVGLIPWLGDLIGTTVAGYMVVQAALMGLPKRVLLRMSLNVAVEMLVGTIPFLGDFFDAYWKANWRNLKLVEAAYHPALPERSLRSIALWAALIALIFFLVFLASVFAVLQLLSRLLG
jgi:hypothetical protein